MTLHVPRFGLVLTAWALACTGANHSGGAAPAPTPVDPEARPSAPSPAPAPAGEHEVVARILETGPIGDGRCSQRSYRIEVVEAVAGAPLESPRWVHFERCQGDTGPIVEGTGLEVDGRYRLRLRDGASPNFGGEPMIVGVSPAS
ncbi:MAG: hypothetical protein R3B09_00080 [Nannocystaceae bacterium]